MAIGDVNKPGQTYDLALMAKAERPVWSRDHLHAMPRDKYVRLKHFLNRRHRSHQGVIAFKDISRFISRGRDAKVDWHSLMRLCESEGGIEEHFWDPNFWMDSTRKPGLAFVAVDHNLLVSRGLFKMALARYALHFNEADTLYGVKVSRWSVDWEMYETWLKLSRICNDHFPQYSFFPEKTHVSQTRQGHWAVDDYLLKLRREDRERGDSIIMCGTEAGDWLKDLEQEVGAPNFSLERLKAHALAA